jgi:hypothetical protein
MEAMTPPRRIPIVCCAHHKSGASYTLKTFRKIAAHLDRTLWLKFYEPARFDPEAIPAEWDICVHQHARVRDLMARHDLRGWRSIRHPKALILSAALYHQSCSEAWVDVPLEEFTSASFWGATDQYHRIKDPSVSLQEKVETMSRESDPAAYGGPLYKSPFPMNGRTYREQLQALGTLQEKVLFEMHSFSRGVIEEMVRFPIDDRFHTIRLEDISHDRSMTALRAAFVHLGFEGQELQAALRIASENCIWNVGTDAFRRHATTGVGAEWRAVFTDEVETEFRRLFGRADETLGYRDE